MTAELECGREAYQQRDWAAAYDSLSRADGAETLEFEDLWRLALAAYLTGRGDAFVTTAERAHHRALEADRELDAARCAFWIGMHLANRREVGPASGWIGRATRLVERVGSDCVERGYLMLPVALQQVGAGQLDAALQTASEAASIGERFGDADLHALALHLQGRALIGRGQVHDGLALMDEAMVAVAGGELSPQVTGLVYCSVIGACRRIYALRRAREWTTALATWCDRQPGLIAYTGECLVYRAELLRLRGSWAEALDEARRACDRLSAGLDPGAAGLALYQQGEVHRLLGDFDAAGTAYREAATLGREPQPGLALLRLAQGDIEAAVSSVRRALAETDDPLGRARLLPAWIEIAIADEDVDEARRASQELAEIAATFGTDVLVTLVAHARGAVELADGDALAALTPLRAACRGWQALDAPYEVARVRALLGQACRELGDDDAADLELDAARVALERLGATPELVRLDGRPVAAGTGRSTRGDAHGLTPRQREVLGLVATGRTNRAIADALHISEKTVARHVADIFARLGVSTRTAATAYAYENDLIDPTG